MSAHSEAMRLAGAAVTADTQGDSDAAVQLYEETIQALQYARGQPPLGFLH